MSEPMPDKHLAEIRKRADAATPGPWDTYCHAHGADGCRCLSCYDDPTGWLVDHALTLDCEERVVDTPNDFGRRRGSCDEGPLLSYEDANFAAHARMDVPALLDEVDRLRTIEADWVVR
jgi:hypothetical protein